MKKSPEAMSLASEASASDYARTRAFSFFFSDHRTVTVNRVGGCGCDPETATLIPMSVLSVAALVPMDPGASLYPEYVEGVVPPL